MTEEIHKADFYDEAYKRQNYFRYPTWIYSPYISSLVAFCHLKKGASVLDVGCGQGFFSAQFQKCGMKVHGIDASEEGVSAAKNQYGQLGIAFSVANIETVKFPEPFDCVFVRSCSLYNTESFALRDDVTRKLLRHLKDDGVLIFAYNSTFSSRVSPAWRYHSLADLRSHFREFPQAEIFFLNKFTTLLLRAHSFSPLVTRLNVLLSKTSGMGGDLVCILRNS